MLNYQKILLLGASLAVLSLPSIALAQDAGVTVTVTREPLPVSKIGQSVDVLTSQDIRTYQSLLLADLLAHTTDVSLTRNGGPGEAASLSLRGAGADHTLYILDGIRLNDPSQVGGGSNLGLLATDDASRIEILRGPLSTLWGSGALGGVVSVTTQQATRPLEGDLTFEGLDRYGSARLGTGGKTGGLNWRLFASTLNDDGVSAFAGGSEKDGFTQSNLSAKLSYNISNNTTLNALSIKTHSRNDYDGFPPPFYNFADTGDFGKTNTWLNAVGINNSFTNGAQAFSLSATRNDRRDYNPDSTPNFLARGRIAAADYHVLVHLGTETRLLGGMSYERDDIRTSSPSSFDPAPIPLDKSMTQSSLYGQIEHDAAGLNLAVSARHDDASSFGGSDIVQASMVALVGGRWRFHASAGQGYKAPSLYQLYSDYGQSGLQPETALTVDGGVDYTTAGGQVSLSAFTRTVHDLIDFGSDGCTAAQLFGCYGNIDRSKAYGVELEASQALSSTWRLRGNYSLLKTRNESAFVVGNQLPHTPEQTGSLDLDGAATSRLNLGLGLRYVGRSFDDAGNTTVLKAHGLVDLRASYALNYSLSFFGRVENAGDTRYQTASGYGQLGRRVWFGIRARLF